MRLFHQAQVLKVLVVLLEVAAVAHKAVHPAVKVHRVPKAQAALVVAEVQAVALKVAQVALKVQAQVAAHYQAHQAPKVPAVLH